MIIIRGEVSTQSGLQTLPQVQVMPVRIAIERRLPQDSEQMVAMRERLIEICQNYLDSGFGDGNAEQRLCSPDDFTYYQQLSEVLLAHQLTTAGIDFTHQAIGPDFCINHNGRRIWIEVIAPTPANIPEAWLSATDGVREFPHEAILLRWTAAIKQKAEVLLGNLPGANGYLANGIVGPRDCYVIAINGRLLRGLGGALQALIGISQFPFAVEATFAVGPLQVRINRETLEASEPEHQQRYLIHKPVGQPVPADTFLDPRFAPISAIWAVDIDEFAVMDLPARMVVVHNPNAINPLPVGFLPAQDEYVASVIDARTYRLDRVEGRTLRPVENLVTVGVHHPPCSNC
ncbi:hypothetical protein EOA23_23695 [Mesorhizobium sp. M2A.F.Ca.ET.042.01.1.1]|uniref:hypothetical protein n=1 Tax=Mesorhizobium sp. M2A.F.Ca.ET.042.01.1.1 TaxID=2496745 RepID=UPI000FCBA97E|nr:hypothetical protein [Mesorhizobium sp. M2A.F.Ca.ET.042.01.1.1]RUX23484.1 hypothetical protein EOA23_23695 [Mesorhizobium sp. M2A.F.Ca.ET.042.01.1.1]